MTIRRAILLVLLGCFVGLCEATLVTFLPSPFFDLRPVLPIVVCLIILGRTESAYLFGVSAGAVLDLFAVGGMTLAFARILLIAFFVGLIAETVLTNHSLYASVALVLLARVLDWLWVAAAHGLGRLAGLTIANAPRWQDGLRMLGLDAGILVCVFLVNHLVVKRFVGFSTARR
jgi:hypothetical protein